VTRYLPELASRDERFKQITLRDLLTMSSGLRYQESRFPSPRGDDTSTYYGVNLRKTALDDARFGLLFLHGGKWNGRRIVSREWVRAATRTQTVTDFPNPYGYFWWIDGKRPDRFYAFGNYGQYIYVDARADVVVVRLGSDWGFGNEQWLATFRAIADQLAA
jgi:CubicO group peptidase (beta-lactamase class C family)